MIFDLPGGVMGILSCLILYYMFKYSEQFSDGNVGSEIKETNK